METPPDHRTDATSIELDPLEWIHRITSHIPDPGRHCQELYGAYPTAPGFAPLPKTETARPYPPAGIPDRNDFGFLDASPQNLGCPILAVLQGEKASLGVTPLEHPWELDEKISNIVDPRPNEGGDFWKKTERSALKSESV